MSQNEGVIDCQGSFADRELFVVFDPAQTDTDALATAIRGTPNMMGANAGAYEPTLHEVLSERPGS